MPDIRALAQTLRHEARLRHGVVPDRLGTVAPAPQHYTLQGQEFLVNGGGYACHYRKGYGVTVRLDNPALQGELELTLAGSVHTAIACLHGLFPLHASAVVAAGGVVALAGPSGAGKSTLAAALAQRGWPLFADDTLLLLPQGTRPTALPGHKRLKLWPEGLALAGVAAQGLVSESYPKHFAGAVPGEGQDPLPLRALIMLEQGEPLALEPVHGAARLALWDDDHYTRDIRARAQPGSPADHFALLARLAGQVPAFRFIRPFDTARFAESVDFLGGRLASLA